MAKEWWQKRLEAARKKEAMRKPKKKTKYQEMMANSSLEGYCSEPTGVSGNDIHDNPTDEDTPHHDGRDT